MQVLGNLRILTPMLDLFPLRAGIAVVESVGRSRRNKLTDQTSIHVAIHQLSLAVSPTNQGNWSQTRHGWLDLQKCWTYLRPNYQPPSSLAMACFGISLSKVKFGQCKVLTLVSCNLYMCAWLAYQDFLGQLSTGQRLLGNGVKWQTVKATDGWFKLVDLANS